MSEEAIHESILDNMGDGVMTIAAAGEIMTFNRAAETILGLSANEVVGKRFGEVFLLHEGTDELNEVVLGAVYESEQIRNKIVPYRKGEETLFLNVTASYLKLDDKAETAVIVVLTDVTETRRLEAEQTRLSAELKTKHRELQDAYLGIEDSNNNLKAAMKRTRLTQFFALGFIALFFIGVGVFYWMGRPSGSVASEAPSGSAPGENVNAYTVAPAPISSAVTLTGELQPLNTVHVTSPFSGTIKEVRFKYGEEVEKGQVLLGLDTEDVEQKMREAEATLIKAAQKIRELETWDKGSEVSEARRNLVKARMELDAQKQSMGETERLYKKGIVPGSEYETSKRQHANAQMGFESAEQGLKNAEAKGGGEHLRVARLELANAKSKLATLQRQLGNSTIRSPVSGTVILPEMTGGDKDKKAKRMEKGVSVNQGEILVSIGDVGSLCVKTLVDETAVASIKKGQKVRITGDAFPGITLTGAVHHVSSQAIKAEGANDGPATFEVLTVIDEMRPEDRKKILLGMSTTLSIVFYERNDAISVPIQAVKQDGKGPFVLVKKQDGTKRVSVEPGITTLNAVEIKSGLKAGDVVVY